MFGDMQRWDLKPCLTCGGSKKDPRKRTRECPDCEGSGISNVCAHCEQERKEEPGILDGPLYCGCRGRQLEPREDTE